MSERTGRQRHAAMPVSPPRTRGAQAAGAMGLPMDLSKHALAGQPAPGRMRGWGSQSDSGDGTPGPRLPSDVASDDTTPSADAESCPSPRMRSGLVRSQGVRYSRGRGRRTPSENRA